MSDPADPAQLIDPFADYTPEEYRAVVERVQTNAARSQSMILTYQLDIGKWLIATLLVLNAGGLVAVANSDARAAQLLDATALPLSVGVVGALACGLFAWVNACIVGTIFAEWLDPFMADDTSRFPKPIKGWKRWGIPGATVLSVASGLTSAGAFVWALNAARAVAVG